MSSRAGVGVTWRRWRKDGCEMSKCVVGKKRMNECKCTSACVRASAACAWKKKQVRGMSGILVRDIATKKTDTKNLKNKHVAEESRTAEGGGIELRACRRKPTGVMMGLANAAAWGCC